MAKQDGLLQFNGAMENLSFYKTRKGGFSVRKKTGVSPQRIATDPKFAKLRANGKEFGQAGRAGKLIRTAFNPLLKNVADNGVTTRLTALCKAVIKTDPLNNAGDRILTEGEIVMLENFDFNATSPLDTSIFVQFTHAFDRAAGTATISIPEFIPDEMIQPPDNATHFRLKAATAALNFGTGKYITAQTATSELALGKNTIAPLTLSMPFPAASTDVLFLTLSIEFLKQEGTRFYELYNSLYNAMRLIAVDVPA